MGPRPGWLRAWRRDPFNATAAREGLMEQRLKLLNQPQFLIVDEISYPPSTELKRPRYSIFTNNPRDRAASNIHLKKRTAKIK